MRFFIALELYVLSFQAHVAYFHHRGINHIIIGSSPFLEKLDIKRQLVWVSNGHFMLHSVTSTANSNHRNGFDSLVETHKQVVS